MSAYMVERHHILYLIQAAISARLEPYLCDRLNAPPGEAVALAACNELQRANVESVEHRYSGDVCGHLEALEPFTRADMGTIWATFNPVQVIKSCHCYAYQACEPPTWESSAAKYIVDMVERSYARRVPGYDAAIYGAPPPWQGVQVIGGRQ